MLGFSATMLKCNQQNISDKCDLVGVLPQADNPPTLFVPIATMLICGFDLLTLCVTDKMVIGHLDIDFGTWKCLCIQECQLYCPVYISVERWIMDISSYKVFQKLHGCDGILHFQSQRVFLLDLMLYRSSPQSQVSLEWKSSKEPPPSFSSSVSLEQSHHLSRQLSSCILVLLW